MTKSMLQLAMLIGVITAVLGFTTDVSAECGGNRCTGRIDRLYTSSLAGLVFVGTDGNENLLAVCNPEDGQYLVLRPNQVLFSEIYASLLEGVTWGRTMIVRVREGVEPCEIAYVVLQRTSTSVASEE